jgi:hypothetical protein
MMNRLASMERYDRSTFYGGDVHSYYLAAKVAAAA